MSYSVTSSKDVIRSMSLIKLPEKWLDKNQLCSFFELVCNWSCVDVWLGLICNWSNNTNYFHIILFNIHLNKHVLWKSLTLKRCNGGQSDIIIAFTLRCPSFYSILYFCFMTYYCVQHQLALHIKGNFEIFVSCGSDINKTETNSIFFIEFDHDNVLTFYGIL